MKKFGMLLGLVLLLALAGYYFIFRLQPAEPASQSPGPAETPPVPAASDLPDLSGTRLDKTPLRLKEVKGPTVLVLFQPDCDHCQREAKEIKANLPAFKDYTLYFVSNYPLPALEQFATDYGLNQQPNVIFASTSIDAILNTLGPQPSPSLYIYNDRGRLVNKFLGETPIGQILPAL
ncbi:MAG: TlpA family protein disulfide reductase [Adhaeribacter sp.]